MKKIRTIIVEDEKPARDLIKRFLEDFSEIEIIDECTDGFMAVKTINEKNPDLLFLDVQLPKLIGFEILELLENIPLVIFSTAYDQYAIKAFELNAVDYLLKPYNKERFGVSIEKAIEKFKLNKTDNENVKTLLDAVDKENKDIQRIAIKNKQAITVLPVNEVVYLEANGDYVMIHTKQNRFIKEKTMKYFESNLDSQKFIRVHRSYIVNVDFIDKLELYEKKKYLLILKTGNNINVSSSGYKLLKSTLNL